MKIKSLTVEQQLRNAMAAAQWRGCDPYDSHTVQAREWQRIARVRAGLRSRSEAQANLELAQLLSFENEDDFTHVVEWR